MSLRILYLSPVRQNPYVRLLAAGVQAADASVRVAIAPALAASRLLPGRRPHILHLHWAELQYSYGDASAEQAFRGWRRFLIRSRLFQALGGKLIYTVHNLDDHEARHPDLNAAANRWLFAQAAAIHVHDAQTAQAVAARFGRSAGVEIIPHGHYLGVYPDQITREQARARFGIGPARFVYLCLGQIRPYKGIEDLIAAFAQLEEDSLLLIAGHVGVPAYGQEIATLAADDPRIQLYPTYVADETLQYFFHAADACVFPYRRATTSGAALLAFSFAKPILAPAIGPFPALAAQGRGALFGEGSAALAEGLRQMRHLDPGVAAAAIRGFLVDRDWPTLGRQHLAMYRRALLARSTAAAAAMVN